MNRFKVFISSEFIFAMFVLAEYFKASVSFIFGDAMIFFFFMSIIFVLKDIIKRNFRVPKSVQLPLFLYFMFILIALISFLYTPSVIYAVEKIIRLLVFTSWCFIGGMLIIKDKDSLKRFIFGVLFVATVMCIASFASLNSFHGYGTYSFSVLGSNYIALGRATAMGAIILLTYIIYSKKLMTKKMHLFLLCVLMLVPLGISGGRLPLISFLISLLFVLVFSIRLNQGSLHLKKNSIKNLMLFLPPMVIGCYIAFRNGIFETVIERFNRLETNGLADSGRVDRFGTAIEMFKSNIFFGGGIGSFPIYYNGLDEADYPHNLFLEIASEFGIISLAISIVLVLIAVYRSFLLFYRKRESFSLLQIILLALFLFNFITIQISGSLDGSKLFWALLGIMMVSHQTFKKTTNILENTSVTRSN